MSYQVLARKWRPKLFTEVVGQEHVITALSNALTQKRLHHAYLFAGTRGVGKTTIARIFAKCLNCETGISSTPCGKCDNCLEIDSGRMLDLIEVDAASRTKVEDTRDLLENIQYLPAKSRFKVYIIDEVHMLSGHSFNALLKTLEEPPEHVKFLLATTDPQKLPITVLSRCLQFNLKIVAPELIQKQLQKILLQENITYEEPALKLLSLSASGSVRDALSLLDQAIAFSNNRINATEIATMLGTVDTKLVLSLLTALVANDAKMIMKIIATLTELAIDFTKTIDELLELLHELSIIKLIPEVNNDNWLHLEALRELALQMDSEEIQLYYQIGLIGKRDLTLAPTPQSGFEMIMLRMLAFRPVTTSPVKLQQPIANTPNNSPSSPETKSSQSNVTPAVATTPESIPTTCQSQDNLRQKLELTGPAKALLDHSLIIKTDPYTIEVIVDPSQASLLNKKQEERIKAEVSKHTNQATINIKLGTPNMATPANNKKLAELAKENLATQTIANDPKINKIINKFAAKIINSSIKEEKM